MMKVPLFQFDDSLKERFLENYDLIHDITSYLGITSMQGAADQNLLQEKKVGLVINMSNFIPEPVTLNYYKSNNIIYKQFEIMDKDEKYNNLMKSYLPKIHTLIKQFKHKNPGKLILVHCFAGVSRSVTVVCYHLMRSWHLPFLEIFKYVQVKRTVAKPYVNFAKLLFNIRQYERQFLQPSLITNSRLFIGDCRSTWNKQWLLDHKISGIIVFSDRYVSRFDDTSNIRYLTLFNCSPVNHLSKGHAFIDSILTCNNNHSNVLIICQDGKNLSPTLAISYLMKLNKSSFSTVFNVVKESHNQTALNVNEINVLQKYETILQHELVLTSRKNWFFLIFVSLLRLLFY